MKKRFYSNGKLLISAEYLVLDGARSLALPTKFGQDLLVAFNESNFINWKSFDVDQSVWFEDSFTVDDVINNEIITLSKVTKTLVEILHHAHLLNPQFLKVHKGFNVETNLSFPRNWGLGTSSTLINNIAQLFQVDAFLLLQNSFGGSGYDIANAQNDSPIIYQRLNNSALVSPISFKPEFQDHLYFVYLNQKQDSKVAIANYRSKQTNLSREIGLVSEITDKLIIENSLEGFILLLQKHESLLSEILELPKVQDLYFSDFSGVVKSLGAWGGDFVLVASHENLKDYFINKGYQTFLKYQEMIL